MLCYRKWKKRLRERIYYSISQSWYVITVRVDKHYSVLQLLFCAFLFPHILHNKKFELLITSPRLIWLLLMNADSFCASKYMNMTVPCNSGGSPRCWCDCDLNCRELYGSGPLKYVITYIWGNECWCIALNTIQILFSLEVFKYYHLPGSDQWKWASFW